jgi:hypothetical protein
VPDNPAQRLHTILVSLKKVPKATEKQAWEHALRVTGIHPLLQRLGVCAAEKMGPNIKWNAALLTTTCSSRSCRKSSYGADS